MIMSHNTPPPRASTGSRKRGLLGDAPSGFIHNPSHHAQLTQTTNRLAGIWNNEDGQRSQKRPLISRSGGTPLQNGYASLTPSPACSVSSENSDSVSPSKSNVSFADKATILDFLNTARDTQLAMVCSLLKDNLIQQQYSCNNLISDIMQPPHSTERGTSCIPPVNGKVLHSNINPRTVYTIDPSRTNDVATKDITQVVAKEDNASTSSYQMPIGTIFNHMQYPNIPTSMADRFEQESKTNKLPGSASTDYSRLSPVSDGCNSANLVSQRVATSEHPTNFNKHSNSSDSHSSLNYCALCDRTFPETQLQHRRSEHHKRRERLTRRGCILCTTGSFVQYPQYVQHIDSVKHKQKKAQLQIDLAQRSSDQTPLQTLNVNNSINMTPPPPPHTTTCGNICAPRGTGETRDDVNCGTPHGDKPSEARVTTASMNILIEENNNVLHFKKKETTRTMNAKDHELKKAKQTEDYLMEQQYIVPVMGYFCKLCQQFYSTENSAVKQHCQSQEHLKKYQELITATVTSHTSQAIRSLSTTAVHG